MSGPGLRHVDSHSSIHEAALNEANELNEILTKLLEANETDKALQVAYVAVEHWETRTLKHAEEEENGLYKELLKASPDLKEDIFRLTRDHDVLRLLIKEIKELLDKEGMNKIVLQKFYSLVHVDLIHNATEEEILPEH
jgi:hemerythrin-like domain-containing protein